MSTEHFSCWLLCFVLTPGGFGTGHYFENMSLVCRQVVYGQLEKRRKDVLVPQLEVNLCCHPMAVGSLKSDPEQVPFSDKSP